MLILVFKIYNSENNWYYYMFIEWIQCWRFDLCNLIRINSVCGWCLYVNTSVYRAHQIQWPYYIWKLWFYFFIFSIKRVFSIKTVCWFVLFVHVRTIHRSIDYFQWDANYKLNHIISLSMIVDFAVRLRNQSRFFSFLPLFLLKHTKCSW